MSLRTVVAVWAARLAGFVSRMTGRAGSSLPGLVARRIDPRVLPKLSSRLTWGTALVTGTNGKTTTAAMVRHMLDSHGTRALSNRAGANLIVGLTAAFAQYERWRIWPRAATALLETDEATMPRAGEELHPRVITVTNFFRDQLDRYGELSTTVRLVALGAREMAIGGVLVLNADDPQVAGLDVGDRPVLFYGLEGSLRGEEPSGYDTRDARFCPRCGAELAYKMRYYAHVGHYHCPSCSFARPHLDVAVMGWDRSGGDMWVDVRGEIHQFSWRIPGLYNLYNQVAAIATGLALEIPLAVIRDSLDRFRPAFGRMEQVAMGTTTLWLALVKNPVGFNQVLATIADDDAGAYSVMILINDRYADGQDVSWLWDVDFENWTTRLSPERWYVGGIRARDMAVRLKYAGVERERMVVDEDVKRLLEVAEKELDGASLYVLPTYTAMLEIRQHLTDRGLTEHFREG